MKSLNIRVRSMRSTDQHKPDLFFIFSVSDDENETTFLRETSIKEVHQDLLDQEADILNDFFKTVSAKFRVTPDDLRDFRGPKDSMLWEHAESIMSHRNFPIDELVPIVDVKRFPSAEDLERPYLQVSEADFWILKSTRADFFEAPGGRLVALNAILDKKGQPIFVLQPVGRDFQSQLKAARNSKTVVDDLNSHTLSLLAQRDLLLKFIDTHSLTAQLQGFLFTSPDPRPKSAKERFVYDIEIDASKDVRRYVEQAREVAASEVIGVESYYDGSKRRDNDLINAFMHVVSTKTANAVLPSTDSAIFKKLCRELRQMFL